MRVSSFVSFWSLISIPSSSRILANFYPRSCRTCKLRTLFKDYFLLSSSFSLVSSFKRVPCRMDGDGSGTLILFPRHFYQYQFNNIIVTINSVIAHGCSHQRWAIVKSRSGSLLPTFYRPASNGKHITYSIKCYRFSSCDSLSHSSLRRYRMSNDKSPATITVYNIYLIESVSSSSGYVFNPYIPSSCHC